MGRGIVEPVDDVRISNPASNPELLDALAKKLVEYNYDLRRIVRDICNSRTYQTTTRPNETNQLDDRNFAKATIRRMRAEVMLDCISQVTETKEKYRGLPPARAPWRSPTAKRPTTSSPPLAGATARPSAPARKSGPTLSQALHLINGTTVEDKITQGGVIKKLMTSNLRRAKSPASSISAASAASRPRRNCQAGAILGRHRRAAQAYHDIFWALLNAKEFMFNH